MTIERKSHHKFEVVRGHELLVRVPLPATWSAVEFPACHRHASNYHCWQSSERGSPAGLRLFGSKSLYDSCCSSDLPPGAFCRACRAAN